MGIREKAAELAAELKRTPDFMELRRAKTAVDAIPALKQELGAFNRQQASLYSTSLSSSETSSRLEQLNRKYAELSRIPEIARYLKASKAFNTVLGNALGEVNSSIESGLK